ncbi:uncharacterized protein LOC133364417 [Rhineura floridana]|uniref:uncharacterized protein LOC133364417 n=1 Tax=Rhineura floridana TaxID=261503 RepID=UPI002AC80C22|nr:uncharacterized protein LOC133364417 [Rhineura floridana]XP_061440884.1 uncharacterized protein LOC133364417 [Rhineura floridana]
MASQKETEQVHECHSAREGDVLPQPTQLLNVLLAARGLSARSVHEQLHELSLATVYCILAALMQCLSLASLCVAISLLKWVAVTQNPYTQQPKRWISYSFGVPDEVDVFEGQNITNSDLQKIHLFSNNIFVPLLISTCFISMLFGFVAFLLAFIEMEILGKHQMAVATFLHVSSGIFLAALVAVCCWCLVRMNERFRKDDLKKAELLSYLGESFYVALLSLAFIILAAALSWWSMKLSR